MKLLELRFNLRHSFEELNNLFPILNNMILNGNICKVFLQTTEASNQYLNIRLYRCKKAFASLEITRLLKEQGEFSQEILDSIEKINAGIFYPHFSLDNSCSIITVTLHSEKYDSVLIPEVETLSHYNQDTLMSLDFTLRKRYPELINLFSITNLMLENDYNVYISFETSKIERKCSYLSFKITYKNYYRPTLVLNFGYSKTFSPKTNYINSLSRWNFITSQSPCICPIAFSVSKLEGLTHGPEIQVKMHKPIDESSLRRIENQWKFCEEFFPQT